MDYKKQLIKLKHRTISLRVAYNIFSVFFGIFFLIIFVFVNFRPSGDEGKNAFLLFLIFASFSYMARFFKWEKRLIQNILDNDEKQKLPIGSTQYFAILIALLHLGIGCYPLMLMHSDEFSGELFIPLFFTILISINTIFTIMYFKQRL